MDFLAADPARDKRIAELFGDDVLRTLRLDRRAMIREIFGTRPLHLKPRAERTVNFYKFYIRRLSHGRFLLAPLYVAWMFCRYIGWACSKTHSIVREIVAPHRAEAMRVSGEATFDAAMRKIHRMKAPTLLEAMRTRVAFDPVYSGAPMRWSGNNVFEERSELDQDLEFLHLREADREELREVSERVCRRVDELHSVMQELPELFQLPESLKQNPEDVARAEAALTVGFQTDRLNVRTLLRADRWLDEILPRIEAPHARFRGSLRAFFCSLMQIFRGPHPVTRWAKNRVPDRKISRRGRRNLKRAWASRSFAVRSTIRAWLELEPGESPREAAHMRVVEIVRGASAVHRELFALRTVQTLSVLDVRNYRRLVFEVGEFAADGESMDSVLKLPESEIWNSRRFEREGDDAQAAWPDGVRHAEEAPESSAEQRGASGPQSSGPQGSVSDEDPSQQDPPPSGSPSSESPLP